MTFSFEEVAMATILEFWSLSSSNSMIKILCQSDFQFWRNSNNNLFFKIATIAAILDFWSFLNCLIQLLTEVPSLTSSYIYRTHHKTLDVWSPPMLSLFLNFTKTNFHFTFQCLLKLLLWNFAIKGYVKTELQIKCFFWNYFKTVYSWFIDRTAAV